MTEAIKTTGQFEEFMMAKIQALRNIGDSEQSAHWTNFLYDYYRRKELGLVDEPSFNLQPQRLSRKSTLLTPVLERVAAQLNPILGLLDDSMHISDFEHFLTSPDISESISRKDILSFRTRLRHVVSSRQQNPATHTPTTLQVLRELNLGDIEYTNSHYKHGNATNLELVQRSLAKIAPSNT